MIKIAHISTGLETGGAEVQLFRLLDAFDKHKFELMVIGLDRDTYLGDRMRELGIPVHALNIKKKPAAIVQAYKLLKEFNPDVIHGTMYEGGVVGSILRRFLPNKPPVIWTVHEGLENYRQESYRKQLQLRLWGLMSKMPESMMYVSHLNRDQHLDWGFNNDKALVIPNGVDTQRFYSNRKARKTLRKRLGIPQNSFVIGITARFHPVKNHIGFINAAALLSKTHPETHFIMVGTNIDADNKVLTNLIAKHSLQKRMHLLGNREDIPDIVNAYDVAALTSFGEAFPLTLGEAMASAVPCVATNVGDNAYIIKNTGRVVPVNDDVAMAAAWQELLEMSKKAFKQLGQAALERVMDKFTLTLQVQQHEDLYETLYQQNQKVLEYSESKQA
ncbi:MAG: glycosyltransferase, partial [Cocleimonas sp.]|nr:glycosyltransferase [Cocleimonas sp.]